MPPGVSADLELKIDKALAGVNQIEGALRQATQGFSVDLARAIEAIAGEPVAVTGDATGVTASIDAAVAGATPEVTATADASGVTGSIDTAVAAADDQLTLFADASDVTASADSAIAAADTQLTLFGEADDITAAIDAAVDAADTDVTVTGTAEIDTDQAAEELAGLATQTKEVGEQSRVLGSVATGALANIASGSAGASGGVAGLTKGVGALSGGLGALAPTLAGVGIVEFFRRAGQEAASQAGAVKRANTIFGEAIGAVEDLGRTSVESFGLSRKEFFNTATQLGVVAQQFGLTKRDAAGLSGQVLTTAADLGAFSRTGTAEALDAVRLALLGSTRGLRPYGIAISNTEVAQRALELGLVDANGQITRQGEITARAALITEKAAFATGAFARGAGGLAGEQARANAALADAEAEIGQALVPALAELQGLLRQDLIPALAELGGAVGPALAEALSVLVAILGPLIGVVGSLGAGLGLIPAPALAAGAAVVVLAVAIGRAREAITAAGGLRAALTGLAGGLNPVTVALVAVGGVIALLGKRSQDAKADAQELIANLTRDIDTSSIDGLRLGVERVSGELERQEAILRSGEGNLFAAAAVYAAASAELEKLAPAAVHVAENIAGANREFGLSEAVVRKLAAAAGIDLRGSFVTVQGQLRSYIATADVATAATGALGAAARQAGFVTVTEFVDATIAAHDSQFALERQTHDVEQAIKDFGKTNEGTARKVKKSTEEVEGFRRELAEANRELQQALSPPDPRDLDEATIAVERAGIAGADAADKVAEAEATLDKLRRGEVSAGDIAEAEERRTRARIAVADATDKIIEAEAKLVKLKEEGADDTQIAKASRELALARVDAGDAADKVVEAERNLALLASPDNAEAIAEAERALTEARLDQRERTIAISRAEDALVQVRQRGTEADKEVQEARSRVEEVTRRMVEAQDRLNESVSVGTGRARDFKGEQLDLEAKIRATAAAAVTAAEEQATLNGRVLTGEEKVRIYRQTLDRLAELTPEGPVRTAIRDLIADLDNAGRAREILLLLNPLAPENIEKAIREAGVRADKGVHEVGRQTGGSIIGGITAGIFEGIDTLAEALLKGGRKAFDAVVDFIKPGSPSRLFADEVGRPIIEGIAFGIVRGSSDVEDALRAAVSPDVSTLGPLVPAFGAASAGLSGSGVAQAFQFAISVAVPTGTAEPAQFGQAVGQAVVSAIASRSAQVRAAVRSA